MSTNKYFQKYITINDNKVVLSVGDSVIINKKIGNYPENSEFIVDSFLENNLILVEFEKDETLILISESDIKNISEFIEDILTGVI